jgi:hypothetical protein
MQNMFSEVVPAYPAKKMSTIMTPAHTTSSIQSIFGIETLTPPYTTTYLHDTSPLAHVALDNISPVVLLLSLHYCPTSDRAIYRTTMPFDSRNGDIL